MLNCSFNLDTSCNVRLVTRRVALLIEFEKSLLQSTTQMLSGVSVTKCNSVTTLFSCKSMLVEIHVNEVIKFCKTSWRLMIRDLAIQNMWSWLWNFSMFHLGNGLYHPNCCYMCWNHSCFSYFGSCWIRWIRLIHLIAHGYWNWLFMDRWNLHLHCPWSSSVFMDS